MADERMRVLELVAEGKITVEQAEALLSALDAAPRPPAPGPGRVVVHLNRGDRDDRHRGRHRDWREPSVEQLIAMGKYGVRPSYLQEARDAGLGHLDFDQIIALAKYGVDPRRARELSDAFGAELDFDQILKLARFGVRPTFLREIRDAGLNELNFDQVVSLAKYGVSPEFIRELGELGLRELSFNDIVQLAKHGISPAFIREARGAARARPEHPAEPDVDAPRPPHKRAGLEPRHDRPDDEPEAPALEPEDLENAVRPDATEERGS